MVVFSALLVFLKLLSILSNLVSAGNMSESYFLCIKGFPEIETYSLIGLVDPKNLFSTWLVKDEWLVQPLLIKLLLVFSFIECF